MVAVGSKSIPEKQSISIGLSKNTEDKLEKELFSEIFSSQGEITDNIVKLIPTLIDKKIDLFSSKVNQNLNGV